MDIIDQEWGTTAADDDATDDVTATATRDEAAPPD